ncbi:hypothetical protein BGZ72_003438 [Mortierella alpina]|nr:hypothetical protein BGZ72_003438 [Mortierella alpina]
MPPVNSAPTAFPESQKHKQQRLFLLNEAPVGDAVSCARAFFEHFKFKKRTAGHDALKKALTSLKKVPKLDSARQGMQGREYKQWEREYFISVKSAEKQDVEVFARKLGKRVAVAGLLKGEHVITTAIDRLGNNSTTIIRGERRSPDSNASSPITYPSSSSSDSSPIRHTVVAVPAAEQSSPSFRFTLRNARIKPGLIDLTAAPPQTPPARTSTQECPTVAPESNLSPLADGDITDVLEEMLPDERMGRVLGITQACKFSCAVKGFDIGGSFTDYFQSCRQEPYRHRYPEDALALSAILLLKRSVRSPRLLASFSELDVSEMADTLLNTMLPPQDTDLLGRQRNLIARWVGWIDFQAGNERETAQKREWILDQLHGDWRLAKELDLSSLYTYFATSVQNLFVVQPRDFQEADGLASFIRTFLAAVLQEVDVVRFSCADKSSTASKYHKAINKLAGQSKQPDMAGIMNVENVCLETFFGEATSVLAANATKYGGDTVRLGVFGKNSNDMINNLIDEAVPLLVFNINGLELQAFVFSKLGETYPMVEIGTGRIPSSVNDLIFLLQDFSFWMKLRSIVRRSSKVIRTAAERGQINHQRRKVFFPTMTTPSARHALRAK